jgi:putative flippase GtrA
MWLIVLPGNYIIDSLVLFIAMLILKFDDKWKFYKKFILKIFLFGLLADIIGSAVLFVLTCSGGMGDEPYRTIPALILSSCCIFALNYFFTFSNCDKRIRIKLSIVFAVFTAPYTFLIPSSFLYH